MKKLSNKSLHWIFTPLRCVKIGEFKRYMRLPQKTMANITTIHFVRHGEVYNPGDVYYGRLPGFRLSDEGKFQATAAAKVLARYPIVAVYSSPLERATETAEEIIKLLGGLELQVSELLSEAFTPFDGQSISFVAGRNWDVYSGTSLPYEQPSDVLDRAKQFVARAREVYRGRQVVATTHDDIIAFLMLWALGKPVTPDQKQDLNKGNLTYGSITSFRFDEESGDELPEYTYIEPLRQKGSSSNRCAFGGR